MTAEAQIKAMTIIVFKIHEIHNQCLGLLNPDSFCGAVSYF